MKDPLFLIIDLFCGAGGTSTGFHMAQNGIAKVIACVNHDPIAIKSHWKNYPEVKHFEEDIRTLDLTELIQLVAYYRKKYPNAMVVLWASLECTNFSKAKGGQPRDADSRTLADHLDRYIIALDPDGVQIENVVEFMSWGPLDENGKPVSRKNGQDWMRWRKLICSHGYTDEWQELNSANFGAYTSRNRLFGVFAKPWFPITWPAPTHSKKPSKDSIFGDLKKWMPVKDVLDFTDKGISIMGRKKHLSDKTLGRVYAGLEKFVSVGDIGFISKYYSSSKSQKVTNVNSLAECGPTITTKDRVSLVQVNANCQSLEQPAGSILAVDKHALVKCDPFIMPTNYNNGPKSIEEPCPTITANRKHHYILNPSHGGHNTSTDNPCPVIVARQDKAPLYLVQAENGPVQVAVYDGDSPIMIRIKQFMVAHGLVDIKMRMLRVHELLRIQGFPSGYILEGNQSDQKKFIGNSVVPHVVKCWIEAMAMKILDDKSQVA